MNKQKEKPIRLTFGWLGRDKRRGRGVRGGKGRLPGTWSDPENKE